MILVLRLLLNMKAFCQIFFREGQGIVAQGVLTQSAVLSATEVLAKHDENYVPPELGEKMQKST